MKMGNVNYERETGKGRFFVYQAEDGKLQIGPGIRIIPGRHGGLPLRGGFLNSLCLSLRPCASAREHVFLYPVSMPDSAASLPFVDFEFPHGYKT